MRDDDAWIFILTLPATASVFFTITRRTIYLKEGKIIENPSMYGKNIVVHVKGTKQGSSLCYGNILYQFWHWHLTAPIIYNWQIAMTLGWVRWSRPLSCFPSIYYKLWQSNYLFLNPPALCYRAAPWRKTRIIVRSLWKQASEERIASEAAKVPSRRKMFTW